MCAKIQEYACNLKHFLGPEPPAAGEATHSRTHPFGRTLGLSTIAIAKNLIYSYIGRVVSLVVKILST